MAREALDILTLSAAVFATPIGSSAGRRPGHAAVREQEDAGARRRRGGHLFHLCLRQRKRARMYEAQGYPIEEEEASAVGPYSCAYAASTPSAYSRTASSGARRACASPGSARCATRRAGACSRRRRPRSPLARDAGGTCGGGEGGAAAGGRGEHVRARVEGGGEHTTGASDKKKCVARGRRGWAPTRLATRRGPSGGRPSDVCAARVDESQAAAHLLALALGIVSFLLHLCKKTETERETVTAGRRHGYGRVTDP